MFFFFGGEEKDRVIDLRSDTVTKPTLDMKNFMLSAPLGDDVFSEDPSVLELEEKVTRLSGMGGALFCPSGTMANQIAFGLNLLPGDQVLGHPDNHVYRWEQGAIARHWGASYKEIYTNNKNNSLGILDVKDFESFIQPDDPHYTKTKLIALENTLNFGGGRIYPLEKIKEISSFALKNKLFMHLDGARIFNAVIESGVSLKEWCAFFDTVSICFSKSLGCPVGSVLLVKDKEDRKKAVRLRKVFGGGMRQAGILAAACIYALENNLDRLKTDHKRAKIFGETLLYNSLFKLEYPVETNMVWFRVEKNAKEIEKRLAEKGLKLLALTDKLLRAVFHLDVTEEDFKKSCELVRLVKM